MGLQGKNIFFTEDNLQNRIIYQTILVRYNVTIKFERWGRDAVNMLQTMPQVDLIVLDLMLAEGVSGFDIYDQIRAYPNIGKSLSWRYRRWMLPLLCPRHGQKALRAS